MNELYKHYQRTVESEPGDDDRLLALFHRALHFYHAQYETQQRQRADLAAFPALTKRQPLNETHNVCAKNVSQTELIKQHFPDKFSPINPHQPKDHKPPKSSSPMRPITKHRALNFDNNNLGDFITRKKTKKKSVPMRRVQLVESSPSVKGNNPFAVDEVEKTPEALARDDRQMLKEMRENKIVIKPTSNSIGKNLRDSGKDVLNVVQSPKVCLIEPCPFNNVKPDRVMMMESECESYVSFGRQIATAYCQSDCLIPDSRLMLLIITKPSLQGDFGFPSFHFLVATVILHQAVNLPAGLYSSCTLTFLQSLTTAFAISSPAFNRLKIDLSTKLELPSSPPVRLVAHLKVGQFDAHQLQRREFFASQNQLAQFRKQRDELYALLRVWQKGHTKADFRADLELGPRVRALVHQVGQTGTHVAFARLVTGALCDAFYEQTNNSQFLCKVKAKLKLPSPDCSLEGSRLDLFEITSQLDVSSFLRGQNAKKVALLEQRLNQSQQKAPPPLASSGHFPGSQSFFRDFLVLGSCSRFHANLLDVLFESFELLLGQVQSLAGDDETTPKRQILLESSILGVIAKFTGFIYFFSRSTNSTVSLLDPCKVRTCPVDFVEALKSSRVNPLAHLTTLCALSDFAQQKGNADAEELRPFFDYVADIKLHPKLDESVKLLLRIKCPPIKKTSEEGLLVDLTLSGVDLLTIEPSLNQLNVPMKLGESEKASPKRTLDKHQKQENSRKSDLSIEEAFFRSHPSSLRRTTDFVTERTVSNCVKHFRTSVIPDIMREVNDGLKRQFKGQSKEELESPTVAETINEAVKTTKRSCLEVCIQKSNDFIEINDVTKALLFLFSNDVDASVVSVCSRVVIREVRAKTVSWFREHVPSIVERDGRAAFERSRNRAILAKEEPPTKKDITHSSPKPVLSYVPLDRLRREIQNDGNELMTAVKSVFNHSPHYTDNEPVQRAAGILVSLAIHKLLKRDECLEYGIDFALINLQREVFTMDAFLEDYDDESMERLVCFLSKQFNLTETDARNELDRSTCC